MVITPELAAEILFYAEGWRKRTIARQLRLHHTTISRVLAGKPAASSTTRPSKIDPFLPFITATLEKYPKLNASRLYNMVSERGYSGSQSHFREMIRKVRPRSAGKAYLRIETLPGEQAQVDWGSSGKLRIGNAERRLLGFVMVLSHSRRIFLQFYLGDETANFLRGHVAAFDHFGCVPREILYDNLKTAVIEGVDNAIRFNEELLRLSAHYRFAPKPVPVARPTSKGKVERSIQYVRTNFFAAREFTHLAELNSLATAWCESEAASRRWPLAAVVECAEHIDSLVAEKRNPEASRNRGMNRILNVAPSSRKFFQEAAKRGHNMGRLTQMLVTMLELYGSADLESALASCLQSGKIHSEAVRANLEEQRAAKGLAPPVPLRFLKD